VGASFTLRDQPVTAQTLTELDIEAPAVLRVNNPVGTVTVEPGREGVIVVQASSSVQGVFGPRTQSLLEAVRIDARSKGPEAHVEVELPETLGPETVRVNLLLTVPPNTNLDLINRAGQVRVTGVAGDLRLRSDVGDVQLREVTVQNEYDVIVDVGRIEFRGRLPQGQGEVFLRTRVGEIDVRLPAGSRFVLDAETDAGTIDAGFELEERQSGRNQGQVGGWLQGQANGGRGVRLVLRAGAGEIRVNPQP
jgi:hypothetical protein